LRTHEPGHAIARDLVTKPARPARQPPWNAILAQSQPGAADVAVLHAGILAGRRSFGNVVAPLPATFLLLLVAVAGNYLVVVELVKGRVMRTIERRFAQTVFAHLISA
jgi:hypothetical protein